MKADHAKNIDEYIAGYPKNVQVLLKQVRETIRKSAPKAEESISYGIPAYKLDGMLIYFAGYKNHISVYPAPRGSVEFKEELESYEGGKGTVQFPLDKPIPFSLIKRIVKFRALDNKTRQLLKDEKKKKTPVKKKASAKKKTK
jgi:uncharacterized protein YdhG (YjbR/CyaY superfamily)